MKQQHLTLLGAACALALAGCGSLVPATDKPAPPLREGFRVAEAPVDPVSYTHLRAHET